MMAVIATGGKQYLVSEGDTLDIEKLPEDVGATVTFDNVLLTATPDGATVNVGSPTVSGATVTAEVTKQGRDKKVRVVKYKNKIRYKRVYGHRQHKTTVKITAVA